MTQTMNTYKTAILLLGCAAILGSCADTSPIDTAQPTSSISTGGLLPLTGQAEPPTAAPLRKVVSPCSTSVIVNGGFETNGGENSQTFSGWTVSARSASSGGGGIFANSSGTGPLAPQWSIGVVPPEGAFSAYFDMYDLSSLVLSQEFVVPAGGGTLSFELFAANRGLTSESDPFNRPATLAWETQPNQQFRVDLMNPNAPIEDLTPGNILQNIYEQTAAEGIFSDYQTISVNINPALAGQTVRLRFGLAVTNYYHQIGIDNVCIVPNSIPVDLDIKPQGTNNRFKLSSDGKKMVAIMSDASFDATTVSPTSIRLGDESGSDTPIMLKKSGQPHYWLQDIDGDGDTDFLMYFSVPALVGNGDVSCGQTEIKINGTTSAGAAIRGVDAITVDCGSPL